MEKMFKNKKIIFVVLGIIFVGLLIFFALFFNKSNGKDSKLKGSIVDISNYSEGFDDHSFYACVVNSYNKENNTNFLITDKLSDEQLASIQTLNCVSNVAEEFNYKTNFEDVIKEYKYGKLNIGTAQLAETLDNYEILNINGIEKLTGLKKFVINSLVDNSNITQIDFSNNKNLEHINLSLANGVKEIKLSENTKLTNLIINMDGNTRIVGLENLFNLRELNIYQQSNYAYEYKELSNLKNLEKLILLNTKFNDFNVIKDLEKLTHLEISIQSDNATETSMSDLKSLSNLTHLYYDGPYLNFIRDNQESLINLKYLNLGASINKEVTKIDFSKFPSLLSLNMEPNDFHFDSNDFVNLDSLVNLESIYLKNARFVYNLSIFPKLNTIYFIGDYSKIESDEVLPNVHTLYTSSTINCNILPNLQYVYGASSVDGDNSCSSNLNQLKEFYGRYLSYFDAGNNYPEIKEFYIDGWSKVPVSFFEKIPNVEKLGLTQESLLNNEDKTDLSNNLKLDTLIVTGGDRPRDNLINGIEKLTNLKNLYIYDSEHDYSDKVINLTNLENLFLYSQCNNIDITKMKKLNMLGLVCPINNLDLSNNKDIQILGLAGYMGDTLDLSNLNKLKVLEMPLMVENISVLKNRPYSFDDLVILPSHFEIQFQPTSTLYAKNNKLYSKEFGSQEVTLQFINKKPYALYQNADSETNVTINTFDLESDVMKIDKERGYIYTNGLLREKDIVENIYDSSGYIGVLYNLVHSNKLKAFVGMGNAGDYDLIKVTSYKYKIENNNIYYYGMFNVDNVRVTNAEKEVNGDKLIIKYQDEIVAEFNLINQGGLLGDTNNDGEISISDLILQYKYTEYMVDLDEVTFYRSDMDSNEDVELKDVNNLYQNIKEGNR